MEAVDRLSKMSVQISSTTECPIRHQAAEGRPRACGLKHLEENLIHFMTMTQNILMEKETDDQPSRRRGYAAKVK